MTKRSSNIHLKLRGWLLFVLLLATAVPGCKEKAATPAPASNVAPLPKKPQQVQPVTPAKAVQAKISSAKKPAVVAGVQKQLSSANRQQLPGIPNLDFTNKRDPFKPFAQAVASQAGTGKSAKTKIKDPLPIQSYDTEKFRVTGIITGLKENSALVIDPVGKGYVLKEGMKIGDNDGYVKRVTNSAVEVEEVSRDDSGRVRKRLVKLMLIRKK